MHPDSKIKIDPSLNLLKALAIVFMTIDHIGLFLFPSHLGFRIIGRLAAPIFTYLIVQGVRHSQYLSKYIARLVILAVFSQIVFYATIGQTSLNIVFNFLLLIAFIVSNWPGRLIVPLVYLLIDIEYGPYILLLGLAFYFIRSSYFRLIWGSIISFGFSLWMAVKYQLVDMLSAIQFFSALASPVIFAVEQIKTGLDQVKWLNRPWPRWLFYAYYPLSWLIIFGIAQLNN